MKKLMAISALIIFTVAVLSACGSSSYPNLKGVVENVEYDSRYKHPVYTITTDNSCTVKVVMDDNSYVQDVYGDALVTGDLSAFDKVKIIADYDARKIRKSSDDIIVVQFMWIDSVYCANAKILSDGTAVGMWDDGFNAEYQLSDGTELMRVNGSSGPDNVYVGNRESFDDLSEAAKPVVLQYYGERGLLYDADILLEQAYSCYKKDKDGFNGYYVDQSVSPSASNEKIMCFLTSVTLPHNNGYMGQEIRYGEIFDKATGRYISGYEIFSCAPEKAIDTVINEAFNADTFNRPGTEDIEKFKSELKTVIKPEYIVLWNENMEISFPAGTLSTEEHCYILGIEYTDEIKSIMHPWAVPDTAW